MATKDPSTGLLSKMAKFVLNPTTNWSELDKPEAAPGDGYSKLALKEMIERKRQNDFVRRREFDYLRKLRRNGHSNSTDSAGRTSSFQTSSASLMEERATTIKKIDEIEAHMSKQWWRGKQVDTVPRSDQAPLADDVTTVAGIGPDPDYQTTVVNFDVDSKLGDDYAPTQMGLSMSDEPSLRGPFESATLATNASNKLRDPVPSSFSVSKFSGIESGSELADPELDEAAIRFANGDDAGAEAGLLAALKSDNVSPESAKGWAAALFDLYRATGQQTRFNQLAADCTQRFGGSSPIWFSIPDLLGHKVSHASSSQALTTEAVGLTVWSCPSVLDLAALHALLDGLSLAPKPWRLNWSRLGTITPEAAKALAELFAQWCATPVQLHFSGTVALEASLRAMTPSGDKRIDSFWWQLRLDALRILRLQDEFELAALDFCVTYEVSPPPWRDAQCALELDGVHAQAGLADGSQMSTDAFPDALGSSNQAPPIATMQNTQPVAEVALSGELLGDALETLNKLQLGQAASGRIDISCSRLIRVDFSAAGGLLNWVTARKSDGCQVHFCDVPRLVAVFFNVIGINEHARVLLRSS